MDNNNMWQGTDAEGSGTGSSTDVYGNANMSDSADMYGAGNHINSADMYGSTLGSSSISESNSTQAGVYQSTDTYYNQNGEIVSKQPDNEEPVTVLEWFITFLILCIPCVGIVMMFVWAFSSKTKKSKSNYFKVQLIWMAVCTVLALAFFFIFAIAFSEMY